MPSRAGQSELYSQYILDTKILFVNFLQIIFNEKLHFLKFFVRKMKTIETIVMV